MLLARLHPEEVPRFVPPMLASKGGPRRSKGHLRRGRLRQGGLHRRTGTGVLPRAPGNEGLVGTKLTSYRIGRPVRLTNRSSRRITGAPRASDVTILPAARRIAPPA